MSEFSFHIKLASKCRRFK